MPKKVKQKAKGAQGKKTPKRTGTKKCKRCGTARGMINRYHLGICRRCFREMTRKLQPSCTRPWRKRGS